MTDTCKYGNPMYVPPDTRPKPLNLYLLSQSDRCGYDTFDSCVVTARTEEDARTISPSGWGFTRGDWASSPAGVNVRLIGTAAPGTVAGTILISSFNAGC